MTERGTKDRSKDFTLNMWKTEFTELGSLGFRAEHHQDLGFEYVKWEMSTRYLRVKALGSTSDLSWGCNLGSGQYTVDV